MTLDEAIKHAEEVAVEMNKSAKAWQEAKDRGNYGWSKSDIENVDSSIITCSECAEEHRQLAEWLKELKQLREQSKWIPVSERLPEEAFGCLVTIFDTDLRTQDEFENILPYFVGYDDETWNDADGEPIPFEVIAWMPSPKPYKAESEE